MIKYGLIIAACCLDLACKQPVNKSVVNVGRDEKSNTPVGQSISPDSLISPGKGIGNIRLGEDANDLINTLGKPDRSDAAMGASLMVWFAGHDPAGYLISIYAHHNMGAPDEHINHIKQIRVTSPAYKTVDGVGPGSLLNLIQKQFKLVKRKVPGINIYDDIKAGISFEMDTAHKCSAVIVHAPMDSPATYIDMRE
jgi:hypothetical protein